MCDYCDCRTRPLLAQLGVDHERLGLLSGQLLQQLNAGDEDAARRSAAELTGLLRAHSALEEGALYPELARADVDTAALYDEHARVDAAFDLVAQRPADAAAEVPAAARELAAHIDREEYDLFPAAHQLLNDEAWDRIERHRTDARGPAPIHDHRP